MPTPLRHARGTVLVAATESTVRGHLRSLLTAWGFDVLECSASAAALDVVGHYPVELALVDVRLAPPGADELIPALLARRAALRVVFLDSDDGEAQLSGDAAARLLGTIGRPLAPRKLDRVVSLVFGAL